MVETLNLSNWNPLKLAPLLGVLLALCAPPCRGSETHDAEPAQSGSAQNALPAPLPSLLQVTGTANRFNISATHADVRSTLRAVFEQSHRQFVPDNSVIGDVTLVLTGQTFDVVLASICKQTFLRYDIDKNGIYQFQRDEQALREAFARMRAINAVIVSQLNRLGYAVPAPDAGQSRSAISGNGMRGGAGGGFGGGGAVSGLNGGVMGRGQSAAGRTGNPAVPPSAPGDPGSATAFGTLADPAPALQSRDHVALPMRKSSTPGSTGDAGAAGAGPAGEAVGPQGPQGPVSARPGAQPPLAQTPLTPYEQMLRDNGLVGIHLTRDQRMPISDVLQQFSRQADVSILIDPALQKENMLTFYGVIVRPLPEALNLLLPEAHLEWRTIGNTIFVTQAPDFRIFYGPAVTPRVVYPRNGPVPPHPTAPQPQKN